MPTISSSKVPTPKSWEEFEEITLSAAKLRWNSTDFYRNGRQGQKQNGVDIWGHDDDERHIGLQCKNTTGELDLDVVKIEIENAEKFTPKLDRLYIVTTAPRDAKLQKSVRDISQKRSKAYDFKVDVLFWDDICNDLAKDEKVFFGHYPQFKSADDPAKRHDSALWSELTTLLRSDGVIGFLNRTNMAGFSFRELELEPIREFYFKWNIPEREFITPELERIKKELWSEVDIYYGLIADETFPTHNPQLSTVPPEWEFEQPDRFWRVVNALHAHAGKIVELHAEIVRVGREKLLASGGK
ncbi:MULTISPECIES: hypothetical protein [Pectobacterium]|uniref:hypothetical protein n=1 Tax=Pectobacterium TaxID=122277 RepID=UPI0018DA3A8A|nr:MULTISPECIES: hypothetical protein [Pectobacterium]QPI41662.1 hypothetical protein I2D83_14350 [Pectobacterium aroidearum]